MIAGGAGTPRASGRHEPVTINHMKTEHDIETTICDACGSEYHERSEGLTFDQPSPKPGNRRLYICERCISLAEDEDSMPAEVLCNDRDPSAAEWESMRDWAALTRILGFTGADAKRLLTKQDVEEFFDALSSYLNWHPDTSFEDYIRLTTNQRTFTDEQAAALGARMSEAFTVCEGLRKVDVYDLGMEAFQRAGLAPKPDEPVATPISPEVTRLLNDPGERLRVAALEVLDAAYNSGPGLMEVEREVIADLRTALNQYTDKVTNAKSTLGDNGVTQLIAAAPDLLAACKRAKDMLEDYVHGETVEMCAIAEVLQDSINAIAKANGVQS